MVAQVEHRATIQDPAADGSAGIGIDERTRGLTQRWFDMVDWRSANVGSAQLEVSRGIEGYRESVLCIIIGTRFSNLCTAVDTKKLEGEVN
jgi:hypothetical protein